MKYNELVGLTLEEATNKLGGWWVVSNSYSNGSFGWHTFNRAPCGCVQLQTKLIDSKNMVVSERHNGYSEKFFKLK